MIEWSSRQEECQAGSALSLALIAWRTRRTTQTLRPARDPESTEGRLSWAHSRSSGTPP